MPALILDKVSTRDAAPKYLQAQAILVAAIRSGKLPPGVKLPATKELAALLGVSLITAHRALENLVDTGWLRREVGRGTFVRDDVDAIAGPSRALAVTILIDHRVNINDYYHGAILESLRRETFTDARKVEFLFKERFEPRPDQDTHDHVAICMHPPIEKRAEVERLARSRPLVVLGGSFPGSSLTCIDSDNILGGRLAARHLLEMGHRRFAMLSGPLNMTNARDRLDGFRDELAGCGITLADDDIIEAADAVILGDDIRARLNARLVAPEPPTAIFAAGFYLAMFTIQTLRDAGRAIPNDVSVIGYDDPPSALLLSPALTTIRQPLAEMTARAYRIVCNAAASLDRENRSELLPPELVVRQSTAPRLP